MNEMTFHFGFQKSERMKLYLEEDRIIWPGGSTKKPTGLMIPTHLTVLTILEKPFVYGRQVKTPKDCDVEKGEIICPLYDTNQPSNNGKMEGCFLNF